MIWLSLLLGLIAIHSATSRSHWIGDEYWTTIDYSGALENGRSISDFLEIPNPDDSRTQGWVAYWITRSKYPGIHYEAFGHAVLRSDRRLCGYFVGDDEEVVEVCGGFRVLSKNRKNPYETQPFKWSLVSRFSHIYGAVGYRTHRIAALPRGGQLIYGDATSDDLITYRTLDEYKGATPSRIEEPIIKLRNPEFSSQVYLLEKNTPEVGPDRTGHYDGHYRDPHTDPNQERRANGWNGHPPPAQWRPQNDQPQRPAPRQAIDPNCHRIVTAGGQEYISCPQPRVPTNSRVDPSDKRLQDPRSNPSYPYYDPIFDPRSPLYDPAYNPYDPRYNPAKDQEWRQAQGLNPDGPRRGESPRRPDAQPRYDPRRLPERRDEPPRNDERVPVRVFRPGPVIPQRNDPSKILPPGDTGSTIVDDQGRVYNKRIGPDGKVTYVLDESRRDPRPPAPPRKPETPPIGRGAEPSNRDQEEPPIGEGAGPREEEPKIGEGAEVDPDQDRGDIGDGAKPEDEQNPEESDPDRVDIPKNADNEERPDIGDGAEPEIEKDDEARELPRDPDQDYVDKQWEHRPNLPVPVKSEEIGNDES